MLDWHSCEICYPLEIMLLLLPKAMANSKWFCKGYISEVHLQYSSEFHDVITEYPMGSKHSPYNKYPVVTH